MDMTSFFVTENCSSKALCAPWISKEIKLETCKVKLEPNVDDCNSELIDIKDISKQLIFDKSNLDYEFRPREAQHSNDVMKFKDLFVPEKMMKEEEDNIVKIPNYSLASNDNIKLENLSANVKNEEVNIDDFDTKNEEKFDCDFESSQMCQSDSSERIELEDNAETVTNEEETSFQNDSSSSNCVSCPHCLFKTNFIRNLTRHINRMHKPDNELEIYKCDYCAFKSKHFGSIFNHTRTHNLQKKTYKCKICDYETKLFTEFKKHKLVHKPKKEVTFKCDHCDFKAKYKHSLAYHLATTHKLGQNLLKCDKCDYHSAHLFFLKRHQITHKSEDEVTLFKCDYCTFTSKHKSSLINHLGGVHNVGKNILKCDKCNYQTVYNFSLNRHKLTHKSEDKVPVFRCEYCTFRTKRKRIFERHVKNANKELGIIQNNFKSKKCDNQSNNVISVRHDLVEKCENKITTFKCDYCNCTFKSKREVCLIDHLRSIHKERPNMLKCKMCDYKTIQKYRLKMHQLVHKSEGEVAMFKCDYCNFKSNYKRGVTGHLRTVHKVSKTSLKDGSDSKEVCN